MSSALELEAHCELDLSFAEESRTSFRDALERRVKGEGIIREVLGIERRVDVRHLSAIEHVESFSKEFQSGSFIEFEAT